MLQTYFTIKCNSKKCITAIVILYVYVFSVLKKYDLVGSVVI